MNRVSALLAFLTLSGPAFADGYPAAPLFSGNKTVMDETIYWPATGPAHVNAMIVTLGPGEKTVLHKHGVPVLIQILEGEVTVDYQGHGSRTYKPGETFLEAMDVAHAGHNAGSVPVRMLAIYMGAEGSQDVVKLP